MTAAVSLPSVLASARPSKRPFAWVDRAPWRAAAALTVALVLSGCASLSADGGLEPVRQLTAQRLGAQVQLEEARQPEDQQRINQRVQALLARPLGPDEAVQVALLNHRGLQAAYAELGITQAEVVQAGRLPNPGFSFGRVTQGSEIELERGLHFNLARVLAWPLVQRLEARRLAQAQAQVAQQVLALAGDTRKAWVQAVAAQEACATAAR